MALGTTMDQLHEQLNDPSNFDDSEDSKDTSNSQDSKESDESKSG